MMVAFYDAIAANESAVKALDRAFTSHLTLQRVELGNTAVCMGIYAAVLHAMGLLERLGGLADPGHDPMGMALADEPGRCNWPWLISRSISQSTDARGRSRVLIQKIRNKL